VDFVYHQFCIVIIGDRPTGLCYNFACQFVQLGDKPMLTLCVL